MLSCARVFLEPPWLCAPKARFINKHCPGQSTESYRAVRYLLSVTEHKSSYCLGLFVGMMLISLSLFPLGGVSLFPQMYIFSNNRERTLVLTVISKKWLIFFLKACDYLFILFFYYYFFFSYSLWKQLSSCDRNTSYVLEMFRSSSIVQTAFSCWRVYSSNPVSVIMFVMFVVCLLCF